MNVEQLIPRTRPGQTVPALAKAHGRALTMSSREIAELVEKRHDNVKRTIETLSEQAVITLPQFEEVSNDGAGPSAIGVYVFSGVRGKRDSLIVVAQLCPEFTARLVDRWQDLEENVKGSTLPDFSDPVAAARAWANEFEARRIAERTKAEIGSRREATAMNTASQAVKKAEKLEQDLDRSKQYASIKRMSMLYHGQTFNWRHLKQVSIEMGVPSMDIFDANYGTVKAYHADVWREAYALEIAGAQA